MEVKYIDFSRSRPSKSGKTRIWRVLAFHGLQLDDPYSLGEIKWCGAWRRYAFAPLSNTIYEQDCMRKIADFCEDQTKKLRAKWKKRKAARDHDDQQP